MPNLTADALWELMCRYGMSVRAVAEKAQLKFQQVFVVFFPPRNYTPPQERLVKIAEAIGFSFKRNQD